MELIPLFISLLYLIKYSIEIIPNWNLDSSGIALSFSSGSITYTLVDREMYSMKVKLTKTITKSGNTITQTNYLSIGGGTSFAVNFENIESFYHLNGIDIICPKGKYHPYDATNKKDLIPDGFEEKGNWDLKCYKHNTNYLLVFYLMNGDKHCFAFPSQYNSMDITWKTVTLQNTNQLFDFKLENGENINENGGWKKYKLAALILEDGYLKLKSYMAEFHNHDFGDNLIYIFDSTTANPLTKNLIQAKAYTQAYFKNYSDEFYFYTYNDISDFTSGYSTVTTDDYGNIGNVQIHTNKSPFDFVDDAHILEMDFVLYNKYIYYTINNTKTGEIYHGLYDVKLDKIMFNTNEDISTYIPYSNDSILAISNDTVFQICSLKEGNQCVEECSSNNVILDSDGNKCGTSCDNGKYLLTPESFCLINYDTNIYIFLIMIKNVDYVKILIHLNPIN